MNGALSLKTYSEVGAELLELFGAAARRIAERPEVLLQGRTCHVLEIKVTKDYQPGSVPDAVSASIAFRDDGRIYNFDEVSASGRVTGGWCGDGIPAGALIGFFRAWLEQTDPNAVDQLSLFA